MKLSGSTHLAAPPEDFWDALLNPDVLTRTIPGCVRLEPTAENTYDLTVTAGVASIKGTYKGSVELEDLQPHSSLTMRVDGAGSAGTIGVTVRVRFEPGEGGTTDLSYDADAVVGGMIGGVGQRMLTSVSKRMAGQFFGAVNDVLTGVAVPAAAPGVPAQAAAAGAGVPAPVAGAGFAPQAGSSTQDLVKGALVGGALVLAGVLAGALAGRRR